MHGIFHMHLTDTCKSHAHTNTSVCIVYVTNMQVTAILHLAKRHLGSTRQVNWHRTGFQCSFPTRPCINDQMSIRSHCVYANIRFIALRVPVRKMIFLDLDIEKLWYESIITCPSVFSVKRAHLLCQPWPLESVVTGFRPSWRMCDLLSPQMSLGNTQWWLAVCPVTDITVEFYLFIQIHLSSLLFLSFFPLSSSTGVFNLLPGKTSLWNYPFWSPGWSACVLKTSPSLNSDVIAEQCQPRVCHFALCHVIVG